MPQHWHYHIYVQSIPHIFCQHAVFVAIQIYINVMQKTFLVFLLQYLHAIALTGMHSHQATDIDIGSFRVNSPNFGKSGRNMFSKFLQKIAS